jgi:hypothetical protein
LFRVGPWLSLFRVSWNLYSEWSEFLIQSQLKFSRYRRMTHWSCVALEDTMKYLRAHACVLKLCVFRRHNAIFKVRTHMYWSCVTFEKCSVCIATKSLLYAPYNVTMCSFLCTVCIATKSLLYAPYNVTMCAFLCTVCIAAKVLLYAPYNVIMCAFLCTVCIATKGLLYAPPPNTHTNSRATVLSSNLDFSCEFFLW